MSLSFRKPGAIARSLRAMAAWCVLPLLCAPAVQAQQWLFTPHVETTAEWDSNRLLETGPNKQNGEWFQGLFVEDIARNTQQSNFQAKAELIAQDSTLKAVDAFEALLTTKYAYRTLKSEYDIIAQFHRQDTYNSEYGQLNFSTLNPNEPGTVGTGTTTATGQLVTGITRDSYQLSPTFSHTFTERLAGELDADFVAVRYSTQIPTELVSFNAPDVSANVVYALSQRAKLAIGPYWQEFNPTDGSAEGVLKSQSTGVNIDYRYQTSKTTNSSILLKLGHDVQNQFGAPNTTSNTWGLEWRGTYDWQTSQLQFATGRFIEPSAVGGEIGLYQIRAQYVRTFTQTLSCSLGARLTREVGITEDLGDRDRGYGDFNLTKLITREIYLTGGYRWILQSLPIADPATGRPIRGPTAVNNGIYLTIGWHPIESR